MHDPTENGPALFRMKGAQGIGDAARKAPRNSGEKVEHGKKKRA